MSQPNNTNTYSVNNSNPYNVRGPLPTFDDAMGVANSLIAAGGDSSDGEVLVSPSRQLVQNTNSDLQMFADLLDSITDVDDRLKLLWKQIYSNALVDRQNAYVMWLDLFQAVAGNAEQHVIHGDHIAKYMERMEKANTQILKLAELVYKAKEKSSDNDVPTGNALFDALEKRKRG